MTEKEERDFFEEFDMIFSYTRAQAIEDGVLVDVSEMAREAGIKFPVAVTEAVWHIYILPDEILKRDHFQSMEGRLWDTLWMFRCYARNMKDRLLYFPVIFEMGQDEPWTVKLKAVCGPGDAGEPVITIMLRNED